jgi:hypothetical protein
MIPWLLITQPSPRDHAAFTRQLTTAPQSKGGMSLPCSARSSVTMIDAGASN